MKKQDQLLFTAGQFAKLHNLNKRTLHYYDDIGLFSPIHVGENGYRYYSYSQSPTLEMLLTLRELNMSIEEVTLFMKNRSAQSFQEIITSKKKEIDTSIDRLRQLKRLLTSKEEMLNLADHSELTQIELIECKEELLILGPSLSGVEDEDYMSILLKESKKIRDSRFFNKTYGTMISSEKLNTHDFDDYHCFFTKVDKLPKDLNVHIKPAGRYIQAFCKGNWDRLPATYEHILKFAKEQGITLTGYSYEVGINEMVINSIDEYITHILVQCE